MKKLLMTLAATAILTPSALANHGEHNLHFITARINGLVCDFCARAVEKVLYRQDGVESVVVDLGQHSVVIGLAEGHELSDEQVTKFVTDAGYNLVEIIRE